PTQCCVHIFLNEICVDRHGCGCSSARGSDDRGTRVDDVARGEDTRCARASVAVDRSEAFGGEVERELLDQAVRAEQVAGTDENCRARNDAAICELDTAEPVIDDDETHYSTLDDVDRQCREA